MTYPNVTSAMLLWMYRYLPPGVGRLIQRETDLEFDRQLWRDDPDMDELARSWRDIELVLDLTGNLDACV